jgi:hypothetical protein
MRDACESAELVTVGPIVKAVDAVKWESDECNADRAKPKIGWKKEIAQTTTASGRLLKRRNLSIE